MALFGPLTSLDPSLVAEVEAFAARAGPRVGHTPLADEEWRRLATDGSGLLVAAGSRAGDGPGPLSAYAQLVRSARRPDLAGGGPRRRRTRHPPRWPTSAPPCWPAACAAPPTSAVGTSTCGRPGPPPPMPSSPPGPASSPTGRCTRWSDRCRSSERTDLETRGFRPADLDEVVEVNRLAFAHHPAQGDMTRAMFEERMARAVVRPRGPADRGARGAGGRLLLDQAVHLGDAGPGRDPRHLRPPRLRGAPARARPRAGRPRAPPRHRGDGGHAVRRGRQRGRPRAVPQARLRHRAHRSRLRHHGPPHRHGEPRSTTSTGRRSPSCSPTCPATGSAQVWDGLYRQARLPAEMTDLPAALRDAAGRAGPAGAGAGLRGRRRRRPHDQVAVGGGRRRQGGERAHALPAAQPRCACRARPAAPWAAASAPPGRPGFQRHLQRRRDRRAGDGRGPPRPAPAPRQRRADGHGRAPRQLRRGVAGPPPPPHRRRPRRPPPHDLDRRPRPRHPAPGRRTGAGEPGGLAARGTRRAAGPAGARQPAPPARRPAGRLRGLPPGQGPAAQLRVGAHRRRQRHRPRRRPSWPPRPARSGPT